MADQVPQTGALVPIPTDGWERVFEGIARSLPYLGPDLVKKLQVLIDPEVLWSLAIVLAAWVGLQLTPLGVPTDLILAAAGLAGIAWQTVKLGIAIKAAYDARFDLELEEAAKGIAAGIVELGVDALIGKLAGSKLDYLKRLVRGVRKVPAKYTTGYLTRYLVAAPALSAVGAVKTAEAAPVVTAQAVDAAKKASTWLSNLAIGAAVVGGGGVLVYGAYRLVKASSSGTRELADDGR